MPSFSPGYYSPVFIKNCIYAAADYPRTFYNQSLIVYFNVPTVPICINVIRHKVSG